jgi:3-hydroxyacyl-[acyl-carrier-protein] dehydratase
MTAHAQMNPVPDSLSRAASLLPQNPEFRFVDRILRLVPGRSGEGEYRVRGDELFLRGHFPGDPLFPGVLLLEAAAQLAGVVALSGQAAPFPELKRTALRSVKIVGTARPGQIMHLEARITGQTGSLIHARVGARVGGEVVLTGDLTLTSVESAHEKSPQAQP